MSTMQITLTEAIFGMGNQNHAHVHRHNSMNLNSMEVDRLSMEQMQGGVLPSTLNAVAANAGHLTSRPQGFVSIEEGFAIRRGIARLTFLVESNANLQEELAVVGYLVGGAFTPEGIDGDTMFVPVRCWTTVVQNVHDAQGFPMARTSIDGSQQFLMGDPFQKNDLKAVRPLDIGNEALGFMACQQDGSEMTYTGTAGSDLRNAVVASKTQNLNPTHHAKELLRLATNASQEAHLGGPMEIALADGLIGAGIGEISPSENPFFHTMMFSTGHHSLMGFQGFSINEIMGVFQNFPEVLNLTLLQQTNFAADTNLATSTEYGSANMFEIMATEVAMLTTHLLLCTGLASVAFSATNNSNEFQGLMGVDNNMVFMPGQAMSMLSHDKYVINRVEQFKQLLAQHFFSKYSGPYAHMNSLISLEVDSHMFGETSVTISFNGETHNARRFTNASYYLNRTSSSISFGEAGLLEAKNFVTNIKEYFQ